MNPPDRGSTAPESIDDVYRALKRGLGRERVNDANVEALVNKARQEGDAQLEFLLREWRAPCGDDPDAPTLPPTVPPPDTAR
jgi:hypothetical protein